MTAPEVKNRETSTGHSPRPGRQSLEAGPRASSHPHALTTSAQVAGSLPHQDLSTNNITMLITTGHSFVTDYVPGTVLRALSL